jgi:uncharacterized protein YydD (DUF2326 family)
MIGFTGKYKKKIKSLESSIYTIRKTNELNVKDLNVKIDVKDAQIKQLEEDLAEKEWLIHYYQQELGDIKDCSVKIVRVS